MFPSNDLGAELYKTWSNSQRTAEIERLVQAYRNGLPLGVVCKMTELIAGSRKRARKHLHDLLTKEEREAAIAGESGGMLVVAKDFLA